MVGCWSKTHGGSLTTSGDNYTLTAADASLGVLETDRKEISGRVLFDWHVIGGKEHIGLIKGPVVPREAGIPVLENNAGVVLPTAPVVQTPVPKEAEAPTATITAIDAPTETTAPTPEPTAVVAETPVPTVTSTPIPTEEAIIPETGFSFDKGAMMLSVNYKLAGLTMPRVVESPQQGIVTQTLNWHYDYDPLYRLTYACSDWDGQTCLGDEFSYTYDAVGNRTSQTINGVTTTYTYDAANRLTGVDGVTYTWDNNGNLLSDGTNTYTYDYANRLVSLSDGADQYTYAYNGLGDRVQQTVNGVATTYVLDLNAGLTQVLSDGADTYLYGLSRIGEESTAWDYYLGDALGSVRQLTDDLGAVSLAQTFQPYGEIWSAYGDGVSSYSYTGEALDVSGLLFLRARYMDPGLGRFISRDTWGGIYEDPLSLNRWMYTSGNPINFVDPSGKYNRQSAVAYAMAHDRNVEIPLAFLNHCTSLASFALWAGGIRDPRRDPLDSKNDEYYQKRENLKYDIDDEDPQYQPPFWSRDIMMDAPFFNHEDLYLREWYVTDELVDFLTNNGVVAFAEKIFYTGVIPQFGYNLSKSEGNRNNDDWINFLQNNRAIIQPGDLVFYKFASGGYPGYDWDHVAIVTGWGIQTYYGNDHIDPWMQVAELLIYSGVSYSRPLAKV